MNHSHPANATRTAPPPVPDERRLWAVTKEARCAEARLRRVGSRVELRVWAAGDLAVLDLFLPGEAISAAHRMAATFREQLIARGWRAFE